MSDSDALRPLQIKVAQYRRQGWQVIKREDDPPSIVLHRLQRDERRGPTGRRGFGPAPSSRHAYRRLWIDAKGKLRDEEVPAERAEELDVEEQVPAQLSKLRKEEE